MPLFFRFSFLASLFLPSLPLPLLSFPPRSLTSLSLSPSLSFPQPKAFRICARTILLLEERSPSLGAKASIIFALPLPRSKIIGSIPSRSSTTVTIICYFVLQIFSNPSNISLTKRHFPRVTDRFQRYSSSLSLSSSPCPFPASIAPTRCGRNRWKPA